MKLKFAVISVLLLCVFSTGLYAAQKNSDRITIYEPVKVANTQLQPGDYKITWDGSGSDVQVSFLQGKKVIASAPAKLVPESTSKGVKAVTTTSNESDNSRVVTSISLKNLSLNFEQSTETSGN